MTKSTPKIGFLSALALSLALAGFGCDSDKKNVIVVDAAVDRVSADTQTGPDTSKPLDVGGDSGSVETGSAETSGDDARLNDDGGPVVNKDAPAPIVDAASDVSVDSSDTSVD